MNDCGENNENSVCNIILKVSVEKVKSSFDKLYSYLLPENFEFNGFLRGCRVKVPFGRGNGFRLALVCGVEKTEKKNNELELKEILEFVDDTPLMSLNMIKLTFYLAFRYFRSVYEVFELMVPSGIRKKENYKINYLIKNKKKTV